VDYFPCSSNTTVNNTKSLTACLALTEDEARLRFLLDGLFSLELETTTLALLVLVMRCASVLFAVESGMFCDM
jgi:hypothetical protein